ncbi:hypothetical protein HZS_4358 [Henneguya salminicola]|nr:hypothetical protein HZS_4358 [Henneguya salminicola]
MALEITEPPYCKLTTIKWWDGYRGQKNVIIDDLHDHIPATYLKRWFDLYPSLFEVKGCTGPVEFTKIVITSNYKCGVKFFALNGIQKV